MFMDTNWQKIGESCSNCVDIIIHFEMETGYLPFVRIPASSKDVCLQTSTEVRCPNRVDSLNADRTKEQ